MARLLSAASRQCQHLLDPNPVTVSLAAFILVGILVSYLPQHHKIISRRSSEGLSPWWVLLGGLSSIAAIGNILVLPRSRSDMACCKQVRGGECAAALLGVAQIGLQWSCFMFIVMLFLIFFPTEPSVDLSSSTASLTKSAPPKKRDAVIVGSATLASLLAVGIISIAVVNSYPHHTQSWADTLGTIAGVLAMVQYLPQIYFTWRMGDVKSLSIITMLIQVPGAFLFAFSLWQRVGWEGWSTWLVYIVTGILQSVVLGLAITYYFRDRRRGVEDNEDTDSLQSSQETEGEASERTALLGSGHKSRPINGTQRSTASGGNSNRQLSMLYAATPPEHDSDRSSGRT